VTILAVVVDAADVGVSHLAGELDLGPEAARHIGIAGQLGAEDLDRDVFVKRPVVGLVDGAHAAAADAAEDGVAARQHEAFGEGGERAAALEAGFVVGGVLGVAGRANRHWVERSSLTEGRDGEGPKRGDGRSAGT
jgi:hypothetical protein